MTHVLLKCWSPLFDLEHEQLGDDPIWVHLSGLPLQLWTQDAFQLIGDDIGQYLGYDRTYLEFGRMTYVHILVFMDTREGLVENLILHYMGFVRNQIMDYEGVPFQCHWCHQVGHVYKYCSLL